MRRESESGDTMTELLKISLPDGSVREVPAGSTPADIAAAIGPGLAKAAIAARVDGELRDITGDVVVGSVGSGGVEARNVAGALTVRSLGSGDSARQPPPRSSVPLMPRREPSWVPLETKLRVLSPWPSMAVTPTSMMP